MTIVLLKSGNNDTYRAQLEAASYQPIFLPVLGHQLSNQDALREILTSGSYTGVIFTSQRAVEAWGQAVKGCSRQEWDRIPSYVVGAATRQALLDLQSDMVPSGDLVLGGEETGRAELLGQYMVKKLEGRESVEKLLYLVGDKRRDILSVMLAKAGLVVQEVTVYETTMADGFPRQLETILKSKAGGNIWIVFFSPSGAQYTIPTLQSCVGAEDGHLDEVLHRQNIRLAAIGPTTAEYLQQTVSLSVAAECQYPTAESLTLALRHADQLV